MLFFSKFNRKTAPPRTDKNRAYLRVEALETRLVPYSASSNAWPNAQLITISFAPDGTQLDSNGDTSNLFATFNATFGSAATWEDIILKAAQQWAKQTNINFAVVNDNGAPFGSGLYQQGDPNMGDIRIGGYNFGSTTLAQTFMPPPVNNTSQAGDMIFNSGQAITNGGANGSYDLFTVAMHEMGHALGLYHSASVSATMYANYTTAKTALGTDDINGIRSIYSAGAARSADAYGGLNSSFATAANISSAINTTSLTGQLTALDINSTTSIEYFEVTLPAGAGGLTVSAQSLGLSLLEPKLTLYAADQQTVLGTAGQASDTGGTATVSDAGATAGQTFYIKVQGYDTTAFGTGNYDLSLSCGANALPAVIPPIVPVLAAVGLNVSAGGGQAIELNPSFQVNTSSASAQTNSATAQAVAMDGNGNYVVVWTSPGQNGVGAGVFAQLYNSTGATVGAPFQVNTYTQGTPSYASVAMNASGAFVVTWSSNGEDGSGWGVYAQCYSAGGVAQGGEFRVNTTTKGDQMYSSVAMDANGDFVITWSSNGQDGSGWGVYAQRYNAAGIAQGGEFLVNTTTKGDQMYSSVAMDADGDFVITWSSNGQDGSGWGVYAQRYNAAGIAQGGEFLVNTTTQGDQTQADVAMNASTGDFIVTWASKASGAWVVCAQRYNAAGVAQGSEFQPYAGALGNQTNPSVSMDGNGNFLITWTSSLLGISQGIYAQQYAAGGVAVGTPFGVNINLLGNQQSSSLAMDSSGDVVVAWTGSALLGGNAVFGQRYLLDGGSGLVPSITSDAFFSQTTSTTTTTTTTTTTMVTSVINSLASLVTSLLQATSPTGHGPYCTCPLCQRLAKAMGMSSASSDGGYVSLPTV